MNIFAETSAPRAHEAFSVSMLSSFVQHSSCVRKHVSAQREARKAWTRGLKTRTANALLAYGFSSRAQVAATPLRRLKYIANLGAVSLNDLLCWLDQRGQS